MPEQKTNTMSFSQTQLEALQTALTQGERRVSFGDKTVEYRSVEELRLAIREVKRGLSEQAASTGMWPGAPRQIRMTTSKCF
jgi:hypothetical protein